MPGRLSARDGWPHARRLHRGREDSMSQGGMIALAAMLAATPGVAFAQGLITERNLSEDAAIAVATGALKKCRADGFVVTVTVLDQGGRVKVVLHDDKGRPHTIEHSLRKAYTALTYRR